MHNFKLKTGISSEPYYNKNSANEPVQFAVCPQCDNPIEIIGLYKKLKNTNSESRKSQCSDFGKNIYNLMRNQFDKVIYIRKRNRYKNKLKFC